MALRMHIRTSDAPSKTRSGIVYSNLGTNMAITKEDIECAKTLISLRNRPVTLNELDVNNSIQHRYNTRSASRVNTPRF